MGAVAAVGLATNIIQLIDVVRSIGSATEEIYRSASGSTKEFEKFRSSTQALSGDFEILRTTLSREDKDEDFHNYAHQLQKNIGRFSAEINDCWFSKQQLHKNRRWFLKVFCYSGMGWIPKTNSTCPY
ncbi:hypothetical protein P154DRAFT_616320 [Amniculicola lignicola CBS 123094]|uniref:Fungal N-terminal domain-containing protein n=1 Tax=Amniculicola lignicola CBS 123094 TaxID=1392246 RepID=A0A6A5X1G5_9PLEO|nr:hypothetical protein P154DRAFT_616320 [Amniculicola lignicola CBS 123094]